MDYQVEFDGTSMVFPCSEAQFTALQLEGTWNVKFRDSLLFLTPIEIDDQPPEYWIPFLLQFIKEAERLQIKLEYNKITYILRTRYEENYGSLVIHQNSVILYLEDEKEIYTPG